MIGTDSIDAIGINKSNADRLSGADFDGDTLSVYSIKERCVAEEFSAGFNPRNLILNKTSSHEIYNSQFGLPKDLCIFLYSFVPPANIKEPIAK